MRRQKKITDKLTISLWISVITSVVFFLVGACMLGSNSDYGVVVMVIAAISLVASLIYYEYQEKVLSKELLSTGVERNKIHRHLLRDLPVPYLVANRKGDQIWHNEAFSGAFPGKKDKKNISQMFPEIYKKVFPADGVVRRYHVNVEERKYRVECSSISMDVKADNKEKETLLAFYFFDETRLLAYEDESKRKSLVAGLIYVDNYDEVLENMEEVRQSLLLALVERKIVMYMQNLDAIIKKYENDKFIFVFEEQNLEKLTQSRFSILDEVRETNIGNDMALTLSISVGVHGKSYLDTYESARIAMDLALGRGGDQAVVRDGDSISYYGGKTQQVEKSTRVKARVKAHALREIILSHDRILVMGHRNPDADCIGAALGIYRLATSLNKETYIVTDQNCPAIEPIIEGVMEQKQEEEVIFLDKDEAVEMQDSSTVLVIVDVNVPGMTECPKLLEAAKVVVVLDHHRQSSETIKNAVLSYVEPYASSTCEMVAEILQYVQDKVRLSTIEADAMYSGILVDTDNFVIKAGVRTFEAAAFLRRSGADVTRVRKMFREDFEHMQLRSAVINRAQIYLGEFAISSMDGRGIGGSTVVGAKAANSLLGIQGIRGSFVFTQLPDCVYISARSIDDVNVQVIMEKFGGGGHLTMAAAQLKNVTVEEAQQSLREVLALMKQNGDI